MDKFIKRKLARYPIEGACSGISWEGDAEELKSISIKTGLLVTSRLCVYYIQLSEYCSASPW